MLMKVSLVVRLEHYSSCLALVHASSACNALTVHGSSLIVCYAISMVSINHRLGVFPPLFQCQRASYIVPDPVITLLTRSRSNAVRVAVLNTVMCRQYEVD